MAEQNRPAADAQLPAMRDTTGPAAPTDSPALGRHELEQFASSPSAMCIFDRETLRLLAANDAALRLYGYSRDEFMQLGVHELSGPAERSIVEWLASPAAILHHAGTQRHVTRSGRTLTVDVVVQDVTFDDRAARVLLMLEREERAPHARLREREALFSAMVEHAPDIIARIDRELRHVYVNPAVASATGLSPDELIGKTSRQRGVPLELCVRWAAGVRRVFSSRMAYDTEISFTTAAGEKYYESRMVPEIGSDGEVESVLAIARDITERKRTELSLRASEARWRRSQREFETLADALPQLIICYDAELRQIYINAATERATGIDRKAAIGRTNAEARYPAHLVESWDSSLRHVLDSREPSKLEFAIVGTDGKRHYEALNIPLTDEAGAIESVLSVAHDITDRTQAEHERLSSIARQRDAFVREVHHRVKNNLQGVVGLLRQVANKHEALAPFLGKAIVQLQAMAVIHGLQGQELHDGVPLVGMVEEIARSVERATGVRIEYLPEADDGGTIVCVRESEAVAMALVLNELMMNATKHRGDEGVVTVTSVIHSRRAVIELVNRGALTPGFDFARSHGIGTGLELVKALVPTQGVDLRYSQDNGSVRVTLGLTAPVLTHELESQDTRNDWDRRKRPHSDRRR